MNVKKYLPILFVSIAALFPLIALVHPGLPLTHDGQDHVARIANFYQSLAEGNMVPRWAANLNWGFGHPILMFLYPLPSYFASLFHALRFSFVDSTKLVFGLAFIASGIAMYMWMNAAFGRKAGLVGGLLYMFAPYRFVDLYVRGDLGEHVAFIFPPLVLYFFHKRSVLGTSISIALLILAHNAVAIMFMPIIGLYALYLFLFESKNKFQFAIQCVLSVFFGFCLSAFFWIPAFFEGKYTLREIVTAGEALGRFVPWVWFLYSPWNYGQGDTLTKSLGFAQWVGVIAAGIVVWKTTSKKIRIFILSTIAVLFVSFFIMTSQSSFLWSHVRLLQDFQFPWRFLAVSVFVAAALGGVAVRRWNNVFVICFSLFIVFVTISMWHPKAYITHSESYYSGIYSGTTDTGESSPIWSIRFMEHTAIAPLQIADGIATITNGFRSSTVHSYTVHVTKPTLFLENTVYFPNWTVYVDGVATAIQYQNPTYRGLLTFSVPTGVHTIRVVFEETKIRKFAEMISVVALVGCVLMGLGGIVWQKRT